MICHILLYSDGSHHKKNPKTTDSDKGISSATVVAITIPIVLLLIAAVIGGWFFYRSRYRTSAPRSEAAVTTTGQGNSSPHVVL